MQSLYLYQAVGGLPTKEYYEEKPILDLYHSVVKGILIDIASHSHRSVKRGLTEDLIEDLALQGEGWPWPWPGKGDDPDGDDKTPGRGGSHKTDEPLDERMETLAGKIVVFERELMRAGADPEFLANPKYAYNPYPTQKVGKALPFLDIPQYLAAFGVRNFPENITVTHPPYLNSVTHLVDATPDYVLSGYFTLRLAMAHGSALGYDTGVWQQLRRLKETLSGLKPGTKEVRQDVCLRWVDEIVGYIAGAEFVDKAFGQDARQDAENIINCELRPPRLDTAKTTQRSSRRSTIAFPTLRGWTRSLPKRPNSRPTLFDLVLVTLLRRTLSTRRALRTGIGLLMLPLATFSALFCRPRSPRRIEYGRHSERGGTMGRGR